MKTTINTNRCSVCTGLQRGYTGEYYSLEYVERIVQGYVEKHNICVTYSPTRVVYPGGSESGIVIGLVNDPLCPRVDPRDNVYALAVELGELLKEELGQEIVFIIGDEHTTALS